MKVPKISLASDLRIIALAKWQAVADGIIANCREAAKDGKLHLIVGKLDEAVIAVLTHNGLTVSPVADFDNGGMKHRISW